MASFPGHGFLSYTGQEKARCEQKQADGWVILVPPALDCTHYVTNCLCPSVMNCHLEE